MTFNRQDSVLLDVIVFQLLFSRGSAALKYSQGLLKTHSMLSQVTVFTFFFFTKAFGSLLWIGMALEYLYSAKLRETGSHLFHQHFDISKNIHGAFYKHPNTFCTYAAKYHTVIPCCCWDYTHFHFGSPG